MAGNFGGILHRTLKHFGKVGELLSVTLLATLLATLYKSSIPVDL